MLGKLKWSAFTLLFTSCYLITCYNLCMDSIIFPHNHCISWFNDLISLHFTAYKNIVTSHHFLYIVLSTYLRKKKKHTHTHNKYLTPANQVEANLSGLWSTLAQLGQQTDITIAMNQFYQSFQVYHMWPFCTTQNGFNGEEKKKILREKTPSKNTHTHNHGLIYGPPN